MTRKKRVVTEPVVEPVKVKAVGPVIYVGPAFKDSYLKRMMVFKEMPAEYADDPVYRHLFVRPAEVSKAMEDLTKEGSLMYTMYQRALNLHKKGMK
jgi:hypothetical protein